MRSRFCDDKEVRHTADPETARREIHSWYYRIYPPASLVEGASYDWPGPDYDTVINNKDARHYRFRKR